MTITARLAAATLALALIASAGASAFADEREENVYADMLKAQQPRQTLYDILFRAPAQRREAADTHLPTASDATSDGPAPAAAPATGRAPAWQGLSVPPPGSGNGGG